MGNSPPVGILLQWWGTSFDNEMRVELDEQPTFVGKDGRNKLHHIPDASLPVGDRTKVQQMSVIDLRLDQRVIKRGERRFRLELLVTTAPEVVDPLPAVATLREEVMKSILGLVQTTEKEEEEFRSAIAARHPPKAAADRPIQIGPEDCSGLGNKYRQECKPFL